MDAPKDIVDAYFLKPFQLIDLNEIEDEDLKQEMWSGVMEFALKHIFERDMLPFLREITPIFKKLLSQGGDDFIGIVLQYILESAEISDNNALIEHINTNISHEIGEKIMTPMEKWKQEAEIKGRYEGMLAGRLEGILAGRLEGILAGRLEGRLEGQIELIKTMLSNGVEPAFIARNTTVSIDDISALQKKLREEWLDTEA